MTATATDALLRLEGLEVAFRLNDRVHTAFTGVDLQIPRGAFVSLVGPSGCGKSTLLNVVAGALEPTNGEIHKAPGAQRPSYVFQTPRLMPWRTVRQNLEFALRSHGIAREEWPDLIAENLELVGLGEYADDYPLRLSGGMQQRVGIARALVVKSELMLMDEPFSHLDEITARRLRGETAKVCEVSGVTVLFVTHDLLEALYLSDEIHVMQSHPGSLIGSVKIDLERPRSYRDPALYKLQAEFVERFYQLMD
jgi:ABC-type nitrate/sulfonate/bicarbonate transport system ATPase subunit